MAKVVYDFYMTQAARALEIACDSRKRKSYRHASVFACVKVNVHCHASAFTCVQKNVHCHARAFSGV